MYTDGEMSKRPKHTDHEGKDDFAARLYRARDRKRLSQQRLADASGISVAVIHKYEQRQTKNPRASFVMAIARALGVSPAALIPSGAA